MKKKKDLNQILSKKLNTAIINYKIVNSIIVTPTTFIDITWRGKCVGNVVSENVIKAYRGPGVKNSIHSSHEFYMELIAQFTTTTTTTTTNNNNNNNNIFKC